MREPSIKSTHAATTDDQLGTLVSVVLDESGTGLTRSQFTDAALLLFEDIAGLERLSKRRLAIFEHSGADIEWLMRRSTPLLRFTWVQSSSNSILHSNDHPILGYSSLSIRHKENINMEDLAMLVFGVTWVSVAVIALRRKLSMTIAIGGFLCSCVLVIVALTLADQPHPAASDTESIAAEPQEATPLPSAQPITEPKEVKKMYYVVTPLTPVCSDFKAIVRVEAVVKLQNPQALDLLLAKAGCELLPNEIILRGDTPIRSMPAGIVSVELDTGVFFFADYHLTRERLMEAEAQRRMLAANPYR